MVRGVVAQGSNPVRFLILSTLLASCTCGSEAGDNGLSSDRSARSAGSDESFVYAPLSETGRKPPARSSILPTRLGDVFEWGERFTPREYVGDLMSMDDADMWKRVAEAIASTKASGATPQDLVGAWGPLVPSVGDRECAMVGRHAHDPELTEEAKRFFWVKYAACATSAEEAAFQEEGVPDIAVFSRFSTRVIYEPGSPPSDREREAIRSILERDARDGGTRASTLVAQALVRAGELDRVLAHRRAHPSLRDALDAGLGEAAQPEAQALYWQLCERAPQNVECQRFGSATRTPTEEAPEEASRVAAAQSGRDGGDVRVFLHANPEPDDALLEELEECARAGSDEAPCEFCLHALAVYDRPRARRAAQTFCSDWIETQNLARSLTRFESADALETRLRELHLLGEEEVPREARSVLDYLMATGRAIQFDVETDTYPNHHDSLLRRLAHLAPSSSVGRATFAETAGEDESYTLFAWRDDTGFSTPAEDLGDWYDVNAVVGMLNSLARSAGDSTRWIQLGTGDQMAFVVAGPADSLQTLLREELLVDVDSDPRAEGLAAEEEIRELLEEEGVVFID